VPKPDWETVIEADGSRLTRIAVDGGHLYLQVVNDARGVAAAALAFIPVAVAPEPAAAAKKAR
jgi:hypothetical protein